MKSFLLNNTQPYKQRLIEFSLISPTVLLAVYFIATSRPIAGLATQGLISPLPTDSGTTVDAIVVLGRGEELKYSRVDVAVQLWRAKRAAKIFASGATDAPQMLELLAAKGIPRHMLGGESCSQTTEENALFTAAILHSQGIRRILLITDPAHMLRAFLTFRSLDFEVIPHTSPLPLYWTSTEQSFYVFREYLGLANYAFLNRFQQRHGPIPMFHTSNCNVWYFHD